MQDVNAFLRLACHVCQPSPCFLRIAHRARKGNPSSLHPLDSLDPEVKTQTIQGGHRHLLRLDLREDPGKQQ